MTGLAIHNDAKAAGAAEMSVGGGGIAGMETFTLVPRGPFSLAASIRFLEGFTPASYSGAAAGVLELAFPVEGSWRTVGTLLLRTRLEYETGEITGRQGHAGRPQIS